MEPELLRSEKLLQGSLEVYSDFGDPLKLVDERFHVVFTECEDDKQHLKSTGLFTVHRSLSTWTCIFTKALPMRVAPKNVQKGTPK